ncbi:MAG TPA: co-chaperone GroES [Anaerolineae bacterium]
MVKKTSFKLRPFADRVVVEALEEEQKTASGLLLPETAKDKPQQGLIVAAGPGRWDEKGADRVAMQVSPEDKVIFARYSGTEIKLDDKKYLIMSEKDILAVLEN